MAKQLGEMGDLFTFENDPNISPSGLPSYHEIQSPILVTPPEHGEITVQALPGQVYFIDSMAPDLARFDRDGGSLVVHQPYGGMVVLRDFLTLTGSTLPPALTLSDGVLIQADEIIRRMWGGVPESYIINSGVNGRTHDGDNGYHGNDVFGAGDLNLLDEDDLEFPGSSRSAVDASSGENPLLPRLNGAEEPSARGLEQETTHVATEIVLGLDDDDDGDVIDRPTPVES